MNDIFQHSFLPRKEGWKKKIHTLTKIDSRVLEKRGHAANLVIVEVPVEISLLQTLQLLFLLEFLTLFCLYIDEWRILG